MSPHQMPGRRPANDDHGSAAGAAGLHSTALGVGADALLLALFDRARHELTYAELRHIAGLADEAAHLMRQMASLCNGLGCMVSYDAGLMADGQGCAGNFQQGDEVASLLWLLGSTAERASTVAQVANMAATAGWQGAQP